MTLTFPGETATRFTNAPYQRVFSMPNTNIFPYGPVLFLDTTVFPGMAFVCSDIVEILPRDETGRSRIPWVPGTNVVVPTTGKIRSENSARSGKK